MSTESGSSSVRFSFTFNGRPVSPARFGWAFAAVFCLGLTLVYVAGARLSSGRRVASFELQHRDALALPWSEQAATGPRAEHAGPVALDPSMNPVALILHFGTAGMDPAERLSRAMVIRDTDGHLLWRDDRAVAWNCTGAGTSKPSTTDMVFGTLDVTRAARYDVAVRFTDPTHEPMTSATLEVRANTAGPSPVAISLGLGAALACLVAFACAKRGEPEVLAERSAA